MAILARPPSLRWYRIAFEKGLLKRSVITLFVVGTVLNTINQSGAIFGNEKVMWLNVVLTFLVPFLVSTFSGTLSALYFQQVQQETFRSQKAVLCPDTLRPHVQALKSLSMEITQNARRVNEASRKRVSFVEDIETAAQDAQHTSEVLAERAKTLQKSLLSVDVAFHSVCKHIQALTQSGQSDMQQSTLAVSNASKNVRESLIRVEQELLSENRKLASLASDVSTLAADMRKALIGSQTNMALGANASKTLALLDELITKSAYLND